MGSEIDVITSEVVLHALLSTAEEMSVALIRSEEWGEWMREALLLDVPHRQVVFTIPRMLRIFFKYNRRLLGELCRSALRSRIRYFETVAQGKLRPGVIAPFKHLAIGSIFTPTCISW
ncbi:MAG: hypothetical protein WAU81_00345 [Candidatus Aminicenantales bacterium]